MEKFASSIKKKYQERRINFEKQFPPCHSNKLIRLDIVERDRVQQKGQEAKRTPLAYKDLFKAENERKPVRKIIVEGDAGIGKTTLCICASEDWADGKLFQQFELLLLLPLRQKQISSAASLPDLLKLLHSSASIRDSVAHYLEEEEGEKVLIIADGWDELSESDRNEDSFLYKLMFEIFPLVSVVLTSRPSASAPLHRIPCIDRFIEVKGFNRESIEEYIHSEFDNDKQKAGRLLERLESNPLVASLCSIPLNCAIFCHLWRTLEEALPTTMAELFQKVILNVILRNICKIPRYGHVLNLPNFDSLPKDLQKSWQHLCEFAFQAIEKDQIVFSQKELAEFFPQDFFDSVLCFGLLQSTESIFEMGHDVSFNFVHLTFQEYLAALHILKQPPETLSKIIISHSIPEINELEYSPKSSLTDAIFTTKSKRFSMVWQLFFGICFREPSHVDIQLLTRFISQMSEWPLSRSLFCHLAFEAKNAIINKSIVEALSKGESTQSGAFWLDGVTTFTFGHSRTAHDCTAVIYVISTIDDCGCMMINFSNSGVRDSQIRLLTDALTSKQGKLQIVNMNLSGNMLSDKTISDLFHRASIAFKSPVSLNLSHNMVGAESIKSIATAFKPKSPFPLPLSIPQEAYAQNDSGQLALERTLSRFPFALTLNLSHTPLQVSGMQALEERMCLTGSFGNLNRLYLNGSLSGDADFNAAWLTTFLEASSHKLSFLDISQNNLSVPGAVVLGTILDSAAERSAWSASPGPHKIFAGTMNLSDTKLGDAGLSAFIESLSRPCNLTELRLTNNTIHAIGVSCLADAICNSGKIKNLSKLYLSNNPLGLEGAIASGRLLNGSHCSLKTLALSKCQLTQICNDGTIDTNSQSHDDSVTVEAALTQDVALQLCQMTPKYTITSLILNGNCFMGVRIQILAGFIRLCPRLNFLATSDCGITTNDLTQLLDDLTKNMKLTSPHLCSNLEKWNLNSNEIDDRGVSALVNYIPSLFPHLNRVKHLHLDSNPVSIDFVTAKLGVRPPQHTVAKPQLKEEKGMWV